MGTLGEGRLHWWPRQVRSAGLRRFLMLVYEQRFEDPDAPEWYRIWQRNRYAYTYALRELHVRLPKRLADADRGLVGLLLHHTPGPELAIIHPRDVQRARRWSFR